MIIERQQTAQLRAMLDTFPVVAVIGARQVGKSTLVQLPVIAHDRTYQTLDNLTILDMASRDPISLLRSASRLTLDEVQRLPDLLPVIKQLVDENRSNGQFLITGSADLGFMAQIARWLAGRVGILRLHPLSWREIGGQAAVRPIWLRAFEAPDTAALAADFRAVGTVPAFQPDSLFVGGYPPAVLEQTPERRRNWFSAFRQTYLEREIRQLIHVAHLTDFNRFIQTTAFGTAQLLQQASIGRELGIPASTLSRYFNLLEATFQIVRLPPYFANIGKRLVKTPKLFWTDTGLCAHLMGVGDWAQAQQINRAGALLETGVIAEIRAHLDTWLPDAELYFVRSHDGLEMDGLIRSGLRLLPFEVKASATVRAEDARHLRAFMEKQPAAACALLFYLGNATIPLAPHILAVPVGMLCA